MDQATRRLNVSVLGSYSASAEEEAMAYALGAELANMGVNVVCGGQKGVMLHVCRGVFENRNNVGSCLTVGLLPSVDHEKANRYVDVVIPTGSAGLQNMIVPLSGDVVIAIGGGAGTLTEISIAWQNKKRIALIGGGWAKVLANQSLDARRSDTMPHFATVDGAMGWVRRELSFLADSLVNNIK